ncbi:MAG: nucleotidyltransferase domain-containing protein [Chloroflexota bacterium]|nr:nucleotidyltransferase domain-containing protein [Chloroflexota bacterium]
MNLPGHAARTNTMTLDEVLRRLAQHEFVDGILLLGSTRTGDLTPTSDYDLLLVLVDLPATPRLDHLGRGAVDGGVLHDDSGDRAGGGRSGSLV